MSLPEQETQTPEHLVTIDEVLAEHPNTSPVPVLPQLSVALGLLACVFSLTYIGLNTKEKEAPVVAEGSTRVEATLPKQMQGLTASTQAFDSVQLIAKSAIVWDVREQRILFNKNADDTRPIASITKLMTALVAHELLDPTEHVEISQRALSTQGDSGLSDGEEFTTQNLIDLTLIESSNDGATALGVAAGSAITDDKDAEAAFVHAMNVRAEELGLTNTRFSNTTGLDISSTEAGAYSTARDVALLMEHMLIYAPEVISRTNTSKTTIDNETGAYHVAENTNDVTNQIESLIASKTGYTALAGGNLVVGFNAGLNRPIVVVVLGSTHEGRFSDTLALVKSTQAYVQSETE